MSQRFPILSAIARHHRLPFHLPAFLHQAILSPNQAIASSHSQESGWVITIGIVSAASIMSTKSLPLWWDVVNDESSFLPFFCPLAFWIGIYLYCRAKGISFCKWHILHDFHNFGAISFGLISMYNNNDEVFNERIPILWSLSYFIVDLVDCVQRLDRDYIIHAGFCLLLGSCNYVHPTLRRLRMNSKAALCESSNPLMHLAKETRKPLHFLAFAIVYTCCRIIWIPIMVRQLLAEGLALTNPIQIALLGFYGLNLFWYVKIIRILVEGSRGKTASKEE